MDAYHQQRRFAGSGDAPPPPQQPPHPSHPNAHWYPAAPPPYPSHPYPPQHHHHWGPPPDLQQQHQRHPPPPQQQLYGYQQPPPPIAIQQQQPPPPPGNPWPPHHASGQPPPPSYPPPPPGQAWSNHSWAQNHGYPGQHRETNHLLDRGPMVSPAQTFGSFPSTYEQEVSYNYSSAPGNGNNMLQYPNSQGQSFPTASAVQGGFPQAPPSMPVVPLAEQPPFGHEQQSVDPSDQPLEFNSQKAPDVVVHTNVNSAIPAAPMLASNYDVVTTSTHSRTPSATVGFLPRAPLPPQAAQMDPHAAPLFGAASSSNYAPPAAFGVGSVTEVFPTDPNTPFSAAEKTKKRPVPNWLREELLKKKSAPSNASAQHPTNLNSMESHDEEQPLRIPDQSDSRSNDSAKSTEGNEDDEDEIEASRVAAINREIKRVLTEVLLKVTDDLFDEIATKVLNEDDSSAESNEPAGVLGSKEPGLGEARTKTLAEVLPAKPTNISSSDHKDSTGLSSPKGALLGLASYDSDDDDDDDDNDIKDKIPISDLSANAGVANTEGDKGTLGRKHMNHDEKKLSLGSTSSGEDFKSITKNSQRSTKVEPEREHIHDIQNGEFPVDVKNFVKPNSAVDKMHEKADSYAAVDVQNRKTSSNNHAEKYDDLESSHRNLEKSSKDFVKEVKTDHAKEHESSTAKKYNNGDKYSIHGNVDKKSSFKEGKGSDRTSKYESYTRDSRSNSKHDDAKADRKDFPKDERERDRDTTDRRGGKGKHENDDRSRQMTKVSTSHSRNSRSRSPRGRSRSRRENSSHVQGSVSSDEPSDSMKKRKHHSRKNSMSPSPPKSRNRYHIQAPSLYCLELCWD
ncbi:hypothetical protein PVAP13_7NG424100 [Panicum virgatum]|uniref:Uncharacterized protein n=1 Tax=Panicum virgatum TaxID=38727 RepID=A0A8T0Q9L4_PANVG|nr:hypothetical protein PVAP13_7NG424100 [Panicum virgatum]KAG2569499.1 hypothetical protein PVAP13_7NG424100 [Panicum virgatum]